MAENANLKKYLAGHTLAWYDSLKVPFHAPLTLPNANYVPHKNCLPVRPTLSNKKSAEKNSSHDR